MKTNELTRIIIDCAIRVHSTLGPGLLESVYKECLFYELANFGVAVVKEKPIPVIYNDVKLDCGFRLDILVENRVVVEIKAVESLTNIHMAQMITYLKLTNCKVGLLINFNVIRLKDGIKRVVNNFDEE